MRNRKKTFGPLLIGALTLGAMSANAELLAYLSFDGGTVGQTVEKTAAIGVSAIGFLPTISAITNGARGEYVTGLSGSLGGAGNAYQVSHQHRARFVLDRLTPSFQKSGVLSARGDSNALVSRKTIYGSILILNNGVATGFTGLEFAAGHPDDTRTIVLGEAAGAGSDFVVLGNKVAAATPSATNLALPTPSMSTPREIVFRIDYNSANAGADDTFTLIKPNGTDGASGTGNFEFATLHLSGFSGSTGVIYDEIRLGTKLSDVFNPTP